MKRFLIACASLAALAALPDAALGAGVVQRYLLVAGANSGGVDRPRLQYAVTDAERFARVLVELGGVPANNEIVLKEPRLRDFLQALDQLSARIGDAKRAAAGAGGRTEVLVYYSGHADEKGLLLGDDRYSYRSFRDRLDQIPADVRIAVLDACASGAFIRPKGGKTRPAFLVDESSTMQGHAFLTSSSATEAAQESDRIAASYFTHYLVSGLRGAADISGDGKVTLSEAYQFAFNETLGGTEQTRGGAQHPSYDITMSGSGDVVMTDVRQTSATLVLGEETAGRFFIRNAARQLVVELYKPAGRRVELGLEPGTYEVRVERDSGSFIGKTQVGEGGQVVLDAALFQKTTPEPTRKRGYEPPSYAVAGRNRIEGGLFYRPGFQYTRFVTENTAVTVGFTGESGGWSLYTMPIGIRWNPRKADPEHRPVKPYLMAGFGPVWGKNLYGRGPAPSYNWSQSGTLTTFEGHLGAGFDMHVARSFTVGLNFSYAWMRDFPAPYNRDDNYGFRYYGGPGMNLTAGWLFGGGRGPR